MKRPRPRIARELGEALRIALDALASARLRTCLTTLGVVVGVATVMAIVAVIHGLDRAFEEQVASLGPHTVYVSKFAWLAQGRGAWLEMRNRRNLGKRELQAVEREAHLAAAVSPLVLVRATVAAAGQEVEDAQVIGTNDRYLETSAGTVGAGRFLSPVDAELSRRSAVLGSSVAERLFPGVAAEAAVGREVSIGGRAYTVVGALERRGKMLGLDLDALVLVPFTTLEDDLGGGRSLVIAAAAAPGKLEALEDELVSILRRVRRVPPEEADDFAVNRQEQFLRLYEGLTRALYGVALGVGFVTLVVGGIGIMNIMLVSVNERTSEIGVRRALGARRRAILLQFLVESSLVSALGGAAGTGLGLGAARLIALVSPLAAAVTPRAAALGLLSSASVGLLFGSWPAWRAAHLDVVEAIRRG